MSFSTENVREEYQPIVGPVKVHLVAVCPTLEEAESLELPMKNEPNYFTSDEDKKQARLDFYMVGTFVEKDGKLSQPDVIMADDKVFLNYFKLAIFVTDEVCTASGTGKLPAGTVQYIDIHGKTAFIEDGNPVPPRLEKEGLMPANRGEATLYEFLTNACRQKTSKGDPSIKLETPIDEIVGGNVQELKDIVELFGNEAFSFYILCGVNDAGYSEVFRNAFASSKSGVNYMLKKAADKGYPWNCEYSTELGYYNPTITAKAETKKPNIDVDYV